MRRSMVSIKKDANSLFKVGDDVRFRFGIKEAYGHIIEDRGSIAAAGRRLWRIRFKWDDMDREIELPEEDFQAVAIS